MTKQFMKILPLWHCRHNVGVIQVVLNVVRLIRIPIDFLRYNRRFETYFFLL